MSRNVRLSIILIVAACLSTILMLHSNRHRLLQQHTTLDQRPDAFMLEVSYYDYDDRGMLHSRLTTPKIFHYPQKNSARFTEPNMMIYTSTHIPWYISAKYGKSQNGAEWVYLWNNVVVRQPTAPANPETTIRTTTMTFYPTKSYAKTNHYVTIMRPGSTVHSVGMLSDFKKGTITLLSHSTGIYEPSEEAENGEQ